jgi:hypothetical protein
MTFPSPALVARSAPFVALVALALVGCGGAPPAFPSEPPPPPTPEASLAALDQAEGELMLALGGTASPLGTAVPGAGAQASPPGLGQAAPSPTADRPAPEQPRATMSSGDAAGHEEAEARHGPSSGDPCSNACRALGSMRRATDHLCNLSGESDARCEGARRRVESAGDRVRFFCPSCRVAGE